jgi:hypothetical protein
MGGLDLSVRLSISPVWGLVGCDCVFHFYKPTRTNRRPNSSKGKIRRWKTCASGWLQNSRSPLRLKLVVILITVYYLITLFIFSQTIIFYYTICLIRYLQQTGEIDNLTVSWDKVLGCVVCRFHVAAGAKQRPR